MIKFQYLLAVIFTMIPTMTQILWYNSFQKFDNQTDRKTNFLNFFSLITDNGSAILIGNLVICIVSMIINAILIDTQEGSKKIFPAILLITSAALAFLYIFQLQV